MKRFKMGSQKMGKTWATTLLLLVFAGLMSLGQGLNAQTLQNNCSYRIVSQGSYTTAQIDNALSGAMLDPYRKASRRRVLEFDQGAKVELFSADELRAAGCPVHASVVMPDDTPIDPDRQFSIHPDGYIVEVIGARSK